MRNVIFKKIIVLLFILIPVSGYCNKLINQFSEIFNEYSVIYIGEDHETDSHRNYFPELVENLVRSGKISVFASESFWVANNKILQKYLLDPAALPKSNLENKYFKEIYGWTSDPNIQSLLRTLRLLKLDYKDRFDVCPIEVGFFYQDGTPDSYSGPSRGRVDERLQEKRRRIQQLSQKEKDKIKKISKLTIEEVILSEENWDREIYLAKNAINCTRNKKSILQVGGNHTLRDSFSFPWWSALSWHKYLDQKSKVASVMNGTTFLGVADLPGDRDYYEIMLIKITQFLKATDLKLFSSKSLPPKVLSIMQADEFRYDAMADFWVFGPQGNQIKDF